MPAIAAEDRGSRAKPATAIAVGPAPGAPSAFQGAAPPEPGESEPREKENR